MNNEVQKILIHILSVQKDREGVSFVKGTVRSGEPKQGDKVWFDKGDGIRRNLVILSVDTGKWHTNIFLDGDPKNKELLSKGYYIYDENLN